MYYHHAPEPTFKIPVPPPLNERRNKVEEVTLTGKLSDEFERIEKKLDTILERLSDSTEYYIELNTAPIDFEKLMQLINARLGEEI